MNWYVKKWDQQFGPFTLEELMVQHQKGDFTKQTEVWVYQKDGWGWVRAENIVELKDIFAPAEKKGPVGIFDAEPAGATTVAPLSHKLWAVAGGKGGVGKSLLASSLGIALTVLGKRVVVIDLDLGAAKTHTLFGIPEPEKTLHDFLIDRVPSLENLMIKTSIDRLYLISGKTGTIGTANILYTAKLKLLSHLRNLDCDFVILDIGAGMAYNQLDFFLSADHKIVVTMPEPHAIQDAFYFIKMALFRKIIEEFTDDLELQDYFRTMKHLKIEKIEDFLNDVAKENTVRRTRIQKMIDDFHPHILLNQVMKNRELKDGDFLINSVKDMLGVQGDYLGYVYYDACVRKALQNLKPFLVEYPKSKAATCIFSIIVHKLLNRHFLNAQYHQRQITKRVMRLNYEQSYKGYRSGIGIYK